MNSASTGRRKSTGVMINRWRQIGANWAMIVRSSAVIAGLVAYYTVDWAVLQELLRDAVLRLTLLCAMDAEATAYSGAPAIRVGEIMQWYSADCTYVSLVLLVAPLIWKRRGRFGANFARVVAMAAGVFALNTGRCWAAACLQSAGVCRFFAHDVIHHAMYWPILLFAAFGAVKDDSEPRALGQRERGGKARDRRGRGSWVVAALVGAVAILSALCVFLGEAAQRPWLALGVHARVAGWLMGTPLERLAPALRFLLLYVPDLAIVGVSAAIVACVARRRWYVWIAVLLLSYGTVFAYRGGSPWVYLYRSARGGSFDKALMFLSFTGVFVMVAILLALAARKFFVSPSSIGRGHCSKCGYDLRGLTEPRCPECGKGFERAGERKEAEN